jgi:hypothetical protein
MTAQSAALFPKQKMAFLIYGRIIFDIVIKNTVAVDSRQ